MYVLSKKGNMEIRGIGKGNKSQQSENRHPTPRLVRGRPCPQQRGGRGGGAAGPAGRLPAGQRLQEPHGGGGRPGRRLVRGRPPEARPDPSCHLVLRSGKGFVSFASGASQPYTLSEPVPPVQEPLCR